MRLKCVSVTLQVAVASTKWWVEITTTSTAQMMETRHKMSMDAKMAASMSSKDFTIIFKRDMVVFR